MKIYFMMQNIFRRNKKSVCPLNIGLLWTTHETAYWNYVNTFKNKKRAYFANKPNISVSRQKWY